MKIIPLFFVVAPLLSLAQFDHNNQIITPNPTKDNTGEPKIENGSPIACNQEMLISYGLEGYHTAKLESHSFCPKITSNCCSNQDEQTSMHLWSNQVKFVVERYYETYLYSIKYLLGFSNELYLLAREFEVNDNSTCRNAAVDYISMNFNAKSTQDTYMGFRNALDTMGEIRRGFYCVLCDAKTQSKLKDFWASTNLFYKDRVYFSKEFCRTLVDNTIRASYYTVYYLKRYVENMATLINCKTNSNTELVYEIPFWTQQHIKNCYYFRKKYFFYFCERYCENFHLTKANPILDGDIGELKKFVDLVMTNRHNAFQYPNSNILMDGVGFEEDYLKYYYNEVFKDTVFYRPTTQQVMLDQFKTDVVYYGGMDPWGSVQDSLYTLVLAGCGFVKVVVVGLLSMVVLAQ